MDLERSATYETHSVDSMNTLHKTRFFSLALCSVLMTLYIQNNKTKSLPFSLTLELKFVFFLHSSDEMKTFFSILVSLSPNSVQRKGETSNIEMANTLVLEMGKKAKRNGANYNLFASFNCSHISIDLTKNCRKKWLQCTKHKEQFIQNCTPNRNN